jgi:hypothetical protein
MYACLLFVVVGIFAPLDLFCSPDLYRLRFVRQELRLGSV